LEGFFFLRQCPKGISEVIEQKFDVCVEGSQIADIDVI
jgi:hypothetical protein